MKPAPRVWLTGISNAFDSVDAWYPFRHGLPGPCHEPGYKFFTMLSRTNWT